MSSKRTRFPRKTRADEVLGQIWYKDMKSLGSISAPHMAIHRGWSWTYNEYFADNDTPSGIRFLLHTTGSDYRVNMKNEYDIISQATRIHIYELSGFGAIVSTGSPLTPVNRKRTVAGSSNAKLYGGVDAPISGILLESHYVPAANKQGGTAGRQDELLLAPNSWYLIALIPEADNGKADVTLNWYEEPETAYNTNKGNA